MATSLTFRYRDGATTYTRTFTALAVKGLDEPDEVELVPPLQFEMSDFHIEEFIRGFRRIIRATIGVIHEHNDRTFMLGFLRSNDRWIYFGTTASVYCALADPEGFENEWKYDTSLMRYYDIPLRENVIYQEWPELVEPTADDLVYIKTDVEITGTADSPQTLTTNAGALATDDTGNPYPAISLAAYAVSVILAEKQDCLITRVSDITQSGTDITFQVAHSYAGNPYADGKYYCTISILLQAK